MAIYSFFHKKDNTGKYVYISGKLLLNCNTLIMLGFLENSKIGEIQYLCYGDEYWCFNL